MWLCIETYYETNNYCLITGQIIIIRNNFDINVYMNDIIKQIRLQNDNNIDDEL